ncbi:9531_t:CDS:2 [Ambispora gerdemannii]|uniref:9531_t:CDS:1 n=1 Tax=Ambispora gerdemannii TaxID=144530 RepID=A0A9N8ZFJ1_9GLOM|nr:9531_t:CDS:2 [Ambispora gerdemannii]
MSRDFKSQNKTKSREKTPAAIGIANIYYKDKPQEIQSNTTYYGIDNAIRMKSDERIDLVRIFDNDSIATSVALAIEIGRSDCASAALSDEAPRLCNHLTFSVFISGDTSANTFQYQFALQLPSP